MTDELAGSGQSAEVVARVVEMRDAGRSWKDIAAACGLTRQQARYAYQLGKRRERRSGRRLTD